MHHSTHPRQLLATLRADLVAMCVSVGESLRDACNALRDGDVHKASAVVDGDRDINTLENTIDAQALALLARTQPVAADLRLIVGALRMVTDLERIGDEVAGIAERTIVMQHLPGLSALRSSPLWRDAATLLHTSEHLYHEAVRAFVDGDAERALHTSHGGDDAAQMEIRIITALLEQHWKDVDPYTAMHIILITRSCNRIWRRASNIAEHVYFIEEGVSLKHSPRV